MHKGIVQRQWNRSERGRIMERKYIAIDLKSFYASVECMERGLDPLRTNLVVADAERTEKTICLAVTPSLKAWGVPGRPRLFEVLQIVKKANAERCASSPGRKLKGKSFDRPTLLAHPESEISFLIAPPRMNYYMECSTKIYQIYLEYVAPEDMHVYSIDEVFMDVTTYLGTYGMSAEELAKKIIRDVLKRTGITATAGIGTNLYLAKIAMDIGAKHVAPDADGVRIASLDEKSYRRNLWTHRPLTDFWRVGKGYAEKLESYGIFTMGDVARCSVGRPDELWNENLLYDLFGVNAELLIDHAWGWEPATIPEIRVYEPENRSICSGQVLQDPYPADKAALVVREMIDHSVLELVEKGMVTDQIVLTVGYDIENLTDPVLRKYYKGPVTVDRYGRKIPKSAHGTKNLDRPTSSTRIIMQAVMDLFHEIVDRKLLVRRISLSVNRIVSEETVRGVPQYRQMTLFDDPEEILRKQKEENLARKKEKKMQQAVLELKKKFGKNAVLKGMNLEAGATAIRRNGQVGGHKA